MIKASAGGGGKGMRISWNDEETRWGVRKHDSGIFLILKDHRHLITRQTVRPLWKFVLERVGLRFFSSFNKLYEINSLIKLIRFSVSATGNCTVLQLKWQGSYIIMFHFVIHIYILPFTNQPLRFSFFFFFVLGNINKNVRETCCC